MQQNGISFLWIKTAFIYLVGALSFLEHYTKFMQAVFISLSVCLLVKNIWGVNIPSIPTLYKKFRNIPN
jgi:hypothetical protein